MALGNMALFSLIIALMWKGKEWREKLGAPEFDQNI
jgi:hypothetical protein